MVHEVDVLNAGPQEPRIVAGNLEEVIMGVVEKNDDCFPARHTRIVQKASQTHPENIQTISQNNPKLIQTSSKRHPYNVTRPHYTNQMSCKSRLRRVPRRTFLKNIEKRCKTNVFSNVTRKRLRYPSTVRQRLPKSPSKTLGKQAFPAWPEKHGRRIRTRFTRIHRKRWENKQKRLGR